MGNHPGLRALPHFEIERQCEHAAVRPELGGNEHSPPFLGQRLSLAMSLFENSKWLSQLSQ